MDMKEQMTWAMTTKTGSTVQSNTIDSITHPFGAEKIVNDGASKMKGNFLIGRDFLIKKLLSEIDNK